MKRIEHDPSVELVQSCPSLDAPRFSLLPLHASGSRMGAASSTSNEPLVRISPVPVRGRLCGLPGASLQMLNLPVCSPIIVEKYLMLIVQLALGSSGPNGQSWLSKLKLADSEPIPLIV